MPRRINFARDISDPSIMVTTRYYDGRPDEVSQMVFGDHSVTSYLETPDVVINRPEPDGFRQPSSYYMNNKVISNTGVHISGTKASATIAGSNTYATRTFEQLFETSGKIALAVNCRQLQPPAFMVDQLRTKILGNIQDEKVDVAMLLAEIGKTAETANNIMARIGRSMLAFQRKSPKSFHYLWHGRTKDGRRPTDKFLRETAGGYLEWKYGIMPSVYDLQGLTQSLDDQAQGKSLFDNPPLMVARANVTHELTSSYTASGRSFPTLSFSGSARTVVSGRARCDFSVTGDALRGLNQYGLGLTSLATVAYDMTPFSFVFNMVVPMAELIKAWGALAGVRVRGYSETLHYTVSIPASTKDWTHNRAQFKASMPNANITYFTRFGSGTVPFPLPHMRNPVKVGNAATVLALFTTLRSSTK